MNYRSSIRLLLVAALVLASVACAPKGIYHTVKPGQTLYGISRAYGIDEAELAKLNGVVDPKRLRAGERLYIPGETQLRNVPSRGVSVSRKAPVRSAPATVAKTAPAQKNAPVAQKPVAKPAAPVAKVAATKPAKGLFVWPLKGKVVGKFGASGKSKGIEIAAPGGTAVIAAAPGKVIYSDKISLRHGNLVVIEHSGGYFTVYGYNRKNLVKQDTYVGQGDKIALSGDPGDGQSARLYFEIRQGKRAVNPIFFLP